MTVEKRGRSDKQAANRIGILVLGMHRSGTSALTRVLSLLGCDLPKTLMGAADTNETGHWESVAIMNLNNEILRSGGSDWHDWLPFNPGWYASPKAAEYKEKALTVLEDEFGRSSLFVLKDPRICRFAPFWIDVLKAAGVQPAIVNQVRNPLEVAESLARRNGFDPALGHLIWLRHVLDAEAGSRGHHRFHSSYEGLLNGWPRLTSEMQTTLNVSWPRLSVKSSSEIASFLSNGLRHHSQSPENVTGNPMLSAWLRETFAIFSRWAQDGENTADHAELDRIRAELDVAAPAFAQLLLSSHQRIEEQREQLAGLAAEREALAESGANLNTELNSARLDLDESRQSLSEAQTALTRSEAELSATRDELSQTRSALAQRSAEADDITMQLRRANDSLAEAESARQEAAKKAEQLASELKEERSNFEAQIRKLRTEKNAAERRLDERFSEMAVMTRLLAEKESVAKASREQLAWLQEISGTLLNGSGSGTLKSRLALLLPEPVRMRKQKERLKRSGIFDADAYLAANPDVAEAGMDPLRHYIAHGLGEGRPMRPSETTGK